MKSDNHLLIIRLSALGDVAMLVPVVEALASQHSDLKITVLSMPMMRPLFERISENVSFIGFDKRGEHKGIKGLNKLFKQLKEQHFTAVADCHDVLRTKYLRLRFKLAGYKVAHIDKHRDGKRALTRAKNKILVQQPTSFENYAETIRKVGFEFLLDSEKKNNSLKPEHENLLIGIAPFAAHQGKIYPLEKTFEVIKLLLTEGAKLYLFGAGSKEIGVFKKWKEDIEKSELSGKAADVIIASETVKGLNEEVNLMSTLDCMLTMDSGNQHLAAIAGTRVVSIWGATHPLAGFLAWRQNEEDCVQTDMPCRPCSIYGNKPCTQGNYPCLNEISPKQIVNRILHKN